MIYLHAPLHLYLACFYMVQKEAPCFIHEVILLTLYIFSCVQPSSSLSMHFTSHCRSIPKS